jgi:tRNA(adenine34) deaminase
MQTADEVWMQRALDEAAAAEAAGEVPIGAVIVKDGELIASGQNRNLRDHDPTAHAEMVALRAAGVALGNHRLTDCEMFVVIEPCAMCAGALVHARLKRLVYGAKDPKAGAVESVMQVINHPRLNHRIEVTSGVLEDRCSAIVREFFRARRAAQQI